MKQEVLYTSPKSFLFEEYNLLAHQLHYLPCRRELELESLAFWVFLESVAEHMRLRLPLDSVALQDGQVGS